MRYHALPSSETLHQGIHAEHPHEHRLRSRIPPIYPNLPDPNPCKPLVLQQFRMN